MFAALELEHDGRTIGEDERIAQHLVHGPDLHVGIIEGVADIDGIIEQRRGTVLALQLAADALEPIGTGAMDRIGRDW